MVDATSLATKSQFQKWDLLQVIDSLDINVIAGQDPERAAKQVVAQRYLRVELAVLGNVVCFECSGFGHQFKDCPTRDRLTYFGSSGGQHASIIAGARNLVALKFGHGQQVGGMTSTLSKTPRLPPKKSS